MALTDQFFTSDPEAYKELFDHANDLIHIVLPGGHILYINNAWEKQLGYSQEEAQGMAIYDFVHPDDRHSFMEYRHRVLNGEWVDRQIEVRLLAKSGTLITVEGSVSVKFTDGKPLYTRGIFRDISRRVEAERRLLALNEILRERENNLHQLLTHAPDAVIVIDQSSNIQFWNSKATTLFGWQEQEVLGRALSETIIPPQYREAHSRGMQRYLATGEAKVLNKPLELTALKRDGTEFYISLTISTTFQNGKLAFIAFLRDIDKEKTTALELEQKQLQLERSNESLEQFAHVASHDMKEPVRKIRFFTELLKSEALDR
ncbi:MAG: PAS domain S-box protein, partial [Chitinophagaceae bacterium]